MPSCERGPYQFFRSFSVKAIVFGRFYKKQLFVEIEAEQYYLTPLRQEQLSALTRYFS